MSIRNRMVALGLAGALTLAATVSAAAGPFPVGTAVQDVAGPKVTDVRWRGRGIGPGLVAGLAAGALVGAAVAAQPYGPDYYYYPAPVYADPYYAPGYVAPPYYNYGYGQCFTNDGYGRRRPCSAN
ncbi:MAG TPA: hypothetical protein VK438_02425 [Xanthobacteraceae bacterium]|nr:hypothetical protein [Xanthobacteraceae bacterium]